MVVQAPPAAPAGRLAPNVPVRPGSAEIRRVRTARPGVGARMEGTVHWVDGIADVTQPPCSHRGEAVKHLLAGIATRLARPVSAFVARLRGTTDVKPLSAPFYALTVPALDGHPLDLVRFSGQVTLVVNVASECGFTPQYAGLQALQDEYNVRGFSVLGVPSNDFGAQEPGSAEEIRTFCDRQYGVTFPLLAKGVTKPGPDQSSVWRRLGESGHLPAWNFYKFLVDRNGQVLAVFPTNVTPESRARRDAIDRALRTGQSAAITPPRFRP